MIKVKRFISMLLAMLMTVGLLAACQRAENKDAQGTTATTAASSQEVTTTEAPEEEITLTSKDYGDNKQGKSWSDWSQNEMAKRIYDELNIKMETLPGGADALQEFNKDAAANMLPDIGRWSINYNDPGKAKLFFDAVEQGLICDLKSVITESAPLIKEKIFDKVEKKEFPSHVLYALANPAYKGGWYAMPTTMDVDDSNTWRSGYGFYIRGDLPGGVEKGPRSLGTAEDFLTLLRQIKAANPKDSGGQTAWPLGARSNWSMKPFFSNFDFGGNSGVAIMDGKVTGFWQTDWPMKQVQFVRTMVKEKLLDPEVFFAQQQVLDEKTAKGKHIITTMYLAGPYDGLTWDKHKWAWGQETMQAPGDKPEWKYQPLGNMVNYTGEKIATVNITSSSTNICFIPASSKEKVKRILKLAEWVNASPERRLEIFNGQKGILWEDDGQGGYRYTSQYWDAEKKTITDAFKTKQEAIALTSDCPAYTFSSMIPYPYVDLVATLNPDAAAFWNARNEMGQKMLSGGEAKWNVETRPELGFFQLGFPGINKLSPVLQQQTDMLNRAYLAKRDEEARKIIEDYMKLLNDNGYLEYIQYLQELYSKDPKGFAEYSSPRCF